MKLTKISLALIAALLSANAFADVTTTPADNSGIYGELQVGYVLPHMNIYPFGNNVFGFALSAFASTSMSLGGKISLGYQFNQNFAAQVGYFSAQQIGGVAPTDPNFKSSLAYYDVALKGMYPLSQSVTLNGLLGLAYANQEVSGGSSIFDPANGTQNAVLPEIGGGIAYNFTPKFNISLSMLYIASSDNGISATFFIPLGISYRF